ncbi:hypothetical protein BJ684DRAFT_15122, partial [Piptocephalis cylindrospora]
MPSSSGTFLRPRGSTLSRFDTAFDWDSDFEEGFMCDDDFLESTYPHITHQRSAATAPVAAPALGQPHTLEAKAAHQEAMQQEALQQQEVAQQQEVVEQKEAVQSVEVSAPSTKEALSEAPAALSQKIQVPILASTQEAPLIPSEKLPSSPVAKPVESPGQPPSRPAPILLHHPSDLGSGRITLSSTSMAKRLTNPPPSPVAEETESAVSPIPITSSSSSSSNSHIEPPSRPMTPLSPSSTRASAQSDCETLAERVPDLLFPLPPATPPLSRLGVSMDPARDSIHPGPPSLSDMSCPKEEAMGEEKVEEKTVKEEIIEEEVVEEKEKEDSGPPLLVITAPSSPALTVDMSRDLTESIDDPALLAPPAFYSDDDDDEDTAWDSDVEEEGYERDEEEEDEREEVDGVFLTQGSPATSDLHLEEGNEQNQVQEGLTSEAAQQPETWAEEDTPLLQTTRSASTSGEDRPSPPARLSWKEAGLVLDRTVPISLACLLTQALPLVSLISIGHLGKEALASAALGNLITAVTGQAIVTGVGSAVDTLCSQAYGYGQKGSPLLEDDLSSEIASSSLTEESESGVEENTLTETELLITDEADSRDRCSLILK